MKPWTGGVRLYLEFGAFKAGPLSLSRRSTMQISMRLVRRVIPLVAAFTIAGGLTALPAQASTYSPNGPVCITKEATNVYAGFDDWRLLYVIPAGTGMRVHYNFWNYKYFGHGAAYPNTDGYAMAVHFYPTCYW